MCTSSGGRRIYDLSTFLLISSVIGHAVGSPRLVVPDVLPSVSHTQQLAKGSRPPAVAVLNGVGFHNEVYCALLWSFSRAGTLPSAFVLKEATSGIQEVISDWYSPQFRQYSDFLEHACTFDVVVFATFPEHHLDLANTLADKACPGQQILLVVHNPGGLESSGARAFMSRVKAVVVALAPHTVRVASEALHLMSLPHPVPVRLFVPVFPIKDLSGGCQTSGNCTSSQAQHKTFLLQGLFQSHRRDYSGLFDAVANSKKLTSVPHFTLRLIGRGDLAIPAALHGRVTMETDLPYKEYYKAVREALAVLPAFSSNAYYTTKASSTVATSIICGTPLLGEQQLLNTYTYLTGPAVYRKQPGESDADAMARLLSTPADEDAARRDAIRALRESLYMLNGDVINEVLTAAAQEKVEEAPFVSPVNDGVGQL